MEMTVTEIGAVVVAELRAAGYLESTIGQYAKTIKALGGYAGPGGVYSPELGAEFASRTVSPRTGRFSPRRRLDYRRLTAVFDSYVRTGRVDLSVRGRGGGAPRPACAALAALDAAWEAEMAGRGLAAATREAYGRVARGYLAFLERRGITGLDGADGGSVLAFLESLLDRWAKSSLFWVVSNFRPFLKFTGRADLVAAVNLAGVRRSRPIIEVLGDAEGDMVVRACAAGRVSARNAAITLLAVTTGLRACDIIALRLADVDWRGQAIGIVQRKTGNPLTLPLPAVVMGKLAGAGAGPAVLRLVDCSLLSPPQAGLDGRSRYVMLETLRAYGAGLLAESGEQDGAAVALAGYALGVAEQAAAGLQTSTAEMAAVRWLEADDAMMWQVLAWAIGHDPAVGVRLTVPLGQWWLRRGRLPAPLLQELAGRVEPGGDEWCAVQFWLGWAAVSSSDLAAGLGYFTAVRDAAAGRGPSRLLADALTARSVALLNMGRLAEGSEDARRALALARELSYPAGKGAAMVRLGHAAVNAGEYDRAVQLIRQALQIPADLPGWMVRNASKILVDALISSVDLAAAETVGVAALAQCREAADDLANMPGLLALMADLDLRAGRVDAAAAHLREELQIDLRAGFWFDLINGLDICGQLCVATGRYAEAITVWTPLTSRAQHETGADAFAFEHDRDAGLRKARQALGADRARAAHERGAGMSLATIAEYALMLAAPVPQAAEAAQGSGELSARERELVALVAQGRTDAQIAAQLYISVRTVSSHLDRIRDRTGCRRRADLTRLALTAGLV